MNKFMRIVVFFDLPVVTAKEKKAAAKFRKIFDKRWVQYDAVVRVFKNL